MESMVQQVVQALDERSPFYDRQRVLKSRIPKKRPVRKIRKTVPVNPPDRTSDHKQKITEKLVSLEEISLRTGAIAIYLTKVKQYANTVDRGVTKLKSLSSKLQNASDEKERNRIHSEIVRTDADVLSSLRKMEMYSSLVSASGGLGADRTYKLLKKMEKQKRR